LRTSNSKDQSHQMLAGGALIAKFAQRCRSRVRISESLH
jgi:hypothetical protein